MDLAHGNLQRSQRPVICTLTADVWGILKVFKVPQIRKTKHAAIFPARPFPFA